MQDTIHTSDDSEDLHPLPSFLSGMKQMEAFSVPEGYFEALPGRVMDKIEDLEAIEAAPLFSSIAKPVNPPVPEGYFDSLADSIQAEIVLLQIKKEVPESASYFEGLPVEIETAILLDKLAISKEEPMFVEADYFDWLPSRIQDRIIASETRQTRFSWLRQWLLPRYLLPASAGFILILLIGIRIFGFQGNATLPDTAQLNLTEKDKKEVIENLDLLGFDPGLVNEHLAGHAIMGNASIENSTDKSAAIDYLIENNTDYIE
jgi:hypothetical protein